MHLLPKKFPVQSATAEMEDRISELPAQIIHQIMSHLSNKQRIQSRILSKTWYDFHNSCPIIEFDDTAYGSLDLDENLSTEFVTNSLLRFHREKLCLQKLHITISFPYNDELVDKWTSLAVELGIEELSLVFRYIYPSTRVSLAKTLTILNLEGCVLDLQFSAVHGLRFELLKELNLTNCFMKGGSEILDLSAYCPFLETLRVSVDRLYPRMKLSFEGKSTRYELLKKLTLIHCCLCLEDVNFSSCFPLLEDLYISDCSGFSSIDIYQHFRLKSIEVYSSAAHCCEISEIDVGMVPSLQNFTCGCYYSSAKTSIKLQGCHNLKALFFSEAVINGEDLCRLLSQQALLESLRLVRCQNLNDVKICNQLLEYFLVSSEGCNSVQFSAPNLQTLIVIDRHNSIRLVKSSTTCHGMRNLLLNGVSISDEDFHNLFAKFPRLEYLRVWNCNMLQKLKVSSKTLKVLDIDGCVNLEAIEVDAPNLCSFLVVFCGEVAVSSLNAQCESKACFKRRHRIDYDCVDMELGNQMFPFGPRYL